MTDRERYLRRELASMIEDMYMHENDRDYYQDQARLLQFDPDYVNEEGYTSYEELENLAEQEDQAARSNWPYIEEALQELSDLVGYKVTLENFND